MTADTQHDAASVRILPPAVPLVAVLLGVGLQQLWPLRLFPELNQWVHYWVGGAIVAGAILILGLWPVILFRRSGQSELPWTPTSRIVESGPFRVTRNPMYLQMVLVCIGIAVILANVWILLLTPAAGWVLQRFAIIPEEAYLERKFGETYRDYKRRVRRWI